MTTKEQDEIIDNAMVQCAVCHNCVPFTHNYYNGRKVDGVGHVCAGCMKASSVFHGTPDAEAAKRITDYIKAKCEELKATKFKYEICAPDGKPLPQKELDRLIMLPKEFAEKYADADKGSPLSASAFTFRAILPPTRPSREGIRPARHAPCRAVP